LIVGGSGEVVGGQEEAADAAGGVGDGLAGFGAETFDHGSDIKGFSVWMRAWGSRRSVKRVRAPVAS